MQRSTSPSDVPPTFRAFTEKFPELAKYHEQIARHVDERGPLDRKTCELIKMGVSIGAGLITATQSHARRAQEQGATRQEIEQCVLLTMNTCGLPRTVAAWQWAGFDQV